MKSPPWRRGAIALAFTLLAAAAGAQQRWDLRDLYPDLAAWEAAFGQVQARADALDRFKPTLGDSAATLREALVAVSDVQRESSRLWVWASLSGDEDLREPRAQERRQRMRALWARITEKSAWLAPAVQGLGAERVKAMVASDPVLKARFDFYLDDTLRTAAHTLAPESEALLAAAGPALGQPTSVFEQITDAEFPAAKLKLADGKTVTLTTSGFEAARTSAVRSDRKKVFDGFFGTFKRQQGTLGANLATQVLADVFVARARRHETTLDAALFNDNMPPAVYRTLVRQANEALPTLHRYLRLRQKVLGIPGRLAYYDNYPPLVRAKSHERWDLERAKAVTLEALAPLGEEYGALLKRTLASPWIDSHPRPGKASGGYMAGAAYDVHPYLLLNHNGDFESTSVLAHEAGHAVHTLLANAAQPYDKAGYATFIAESASIGNQMLLLDHLSAKAKTREEKLFYIGEGLEMIRTTFFRQVMFAEFQLAINQEVEQGRALSGARLTDLYCGVARRYYGEAEGVMSIDPVYCNEWAYVSHFFRGYYVWQYASSIVGAAQFAEAIAKEGAPARDRFINLLKAGGSDYPYTLYVKAGIDLAQAAPYQALVARMNRLMDEFEATWKARGTL